MIRILLLKDDKIDYKSDVTHIRLGFIYEVHSLSLFYYDPDVDKYIDWQSYGKYELGLLYNFRDRSEIKYLHVYPKELQ